MQKRHRTSSIAYVFKRRQTIAPISVSQILQLATMPVLDSEIPPIPAPLHIRVDPHCGRKYHASRALPENTDLLGSCGPYSYTIWKRFRNEVCAECWRYDGGRRTFLTLRDDKGLGGPMPNGDAQRSSTTAGLWFCDSRCQGEWVAREGVEAVDLLRQLEAARKKTSPKPKSDAGGQQAAEGEITQEVAERAWNVVRDKERSPKEVRKWRTLQLEDYEADMARYVLLALYRRHREQYRNRSTSRKDSTLGPQSEEPTTATDDEPSGWQTFASLQANELQLLNACPQILQHQTRIYQLLKGLLGSRAAERSNRSSRSSSVAAEPQAHADNARTREVDDSASACEEPHLADLVTIANVRTILSVDPGNAFGIWEVPLMEESECLGFALYPVPSFFNHRESRLSVRGRD